MPYFSLKGKLDPTTHPVPLPSVPEQCCSRGSGGTSFLGALLHQRSQATQATQYTCTPLSGITAAVSHHLSSWKESVSKQKPETAVPAHEISRTTFPLQGEGKISDGKQQ